MKIATGLSAFMLLYGMAMGQARIHLANDASIVIDNGAFLVIDNPNPNAITTAASGGNILSESENDLVRWNIGANTGNFQVPWTTGTGVKIPLTIDITTAGTGSGHLLLSTHPDNDAVDNWNNDDYRPSDVTNMGGASIPNNSPNVIDRFWRIQHQGFSAAPQATLTFAYDDAERTNPGNTIPAGSLFAQRFSTSQNAWIDVGLGTDNHPTLTVSGAVVSSDFFRSWTLAHNAVPLFEAALLFELQAEASGPILHWELDGELPRRMLLERKGPTGQFEALKEIPSGEMRRFSHPDEQPLTGLNQYRLRMESAQGEWLYSEVRSFFWSAGLHWSIAPNPSVQGHAQLLLEGAEGLVLRAELCDLRGKRCWSRSFECEAPAQSIPLELRDLASGMYLLRLSGKGGSYGVQKLLVE